MDINTAKEKYEDAKAEHSNFVSEAKRAMTQYDTGLTGDSKDSTFQAVFNFSKELIDAQLKIDIPVPMVTPQIENEKNKERARMITAMLRNEIDRIPMETLNDMWERETHIIGGSLAVVEYIMSEDYTGGNIKLKHITPTNFIPQPGIDDVNEMDYYFITQDVTKKYIVAEYGKQYKDAIESEGQDSDNETQNDELITLILMFYRRKSVWGHIAWVGDVVLADYDDYYARKNDVCVKCGTKTVDKCPSCGGTKTVKQNDDVKYLQEQLKTRYFDIPAETVATDDNGQPLTYDIPLNDGTVKTVFMTQPNTIPYYKIKAAPVSVRRNSTISGKLFGRGDCATIQGLQYSANKATTKIAEKQETSGYIMTKPDSLDFELSNRMGKVVSLASPEQLTMMKSIPFEFNATGDLNTVNQMYQWAKSELAVTDSYQGKPDSTATSGRAKEAQISQSAGIHRVGQALKNDFFANIYRAIFQAKLSYDDSTTDYVDKTGAAEKTYHFKSVDFLDIDNNGQYFYEDRFNFGVDETGVNPNNRSEVMQYLTQDFTSGLYGDPTSPQARLNFWRERQHLDYPGSSRWVEYWEQQVQQTQELPPQGVPQQGVPYA